MPGGSEPPSPASPDHTATVADLIDRWETRRASLARLNAQVDGAALAGDILADLAGLAAAEQPISLSAAAAGTGYTPDHLSRLIAQGKLTNYGRKHAPRVRLSECPTKPKHAIRLAERYANAYHPITDARSLVGSRR